MVIAVPVLLVSHEIFCHLLAIISKTSAAAIRDLAAIFAYLITLAAPTAAVLAKALSCLNWLWRTGKLAWLQMVSIGTLIEEEIRLVEPVKKASETLVLCLLQGCPRSRCPSRLYLSCRHGMGFGSLQRSLPELQFSLRSWQEKMLFNSLQNCSEGEEGKEKGVISQFCQSAFYLPYLNLLEEKVFTKVTSFSLTFLGALCGGGGFPVAEKVFLSLEIGACLE